MAISIADLYASGDRIQHYDVDQDEIKKFFNDYFIEVILSIVRQYP